MLMDAIHGRALTPRSCSRRAAAQVMSEDPRLTGALGAAYVAGMQNNSNTQGEEGRYLMAACCKHYAIYSACAHRCHSLELAGSLQLLHH